jgi:multidrug efflux system membrane fusion protein
MAQHDSHDPGQDSTQDPRLQRESMGQSFEAHTGNTGAAFEERNLAPVEPPRRSHRGLWITLVVVLLLAIFLVHHFTTPNSADGSGGAAGASGATGGSGAKGRGQNGPAAITVGQSKTGNINIYVQALGTVTPTATVTLYSQITGRVMAVYYKEGQLVKKGQPLVDIDPRPSEAALQQAQGQLTHDQGVLAEAKIDLARYQAAYARNAIAKQQLDDQEQAVVQDQGTVQADEGPVAGDKVQLSYCHIVAPISGKVGLRLVDPGNTVFSGSSSTLVVITQLQPITVVFNVSEDDLPRVQAQLKGKKTLEVNAFDRANEKQLESGKLTSVDNQIDTTTGTVKFRASFPNTDLSLFPNQFVNAQLLVTTLQNATLVPTAAVQHNGTAAFVYIVNPNNTVKVQPVTTATSNEQVTAVTGIGPNVSLATSGFDRLENGVHVAVKGQGQRGAKGVSGSTGASGGTSGNGTTGAP